MLNALALHHRNKTPALEQALIIPSKALHWPNHTEMQLLNMLPL